MIKFIFKLYYLIQKTLSESAVMNVEFSSFSDVIIVEFAVSKDFDCIQVEVNVHALEMDTLPSIIFLRL